VIRRTRGRDIEAESLPTRVHRDEAVTRRIVGPRAVGNAEIAGGTVAARHHAARATHERHVDPPLIPRETFGWTQLPERTAIVAGRTNGYTVRRGGRPRIIVSVTAALTTAGEIALYKNDVTFETWMANSTLPGPWVITIPTGSTGVIVDEVFDIQFRELDIADHEVTNAGVGGEGLTVEWWFG
jgi:hypothetical protein